MKNEIVHIEEYKNLQANYCHLLPVVSQEINSEGGFQSYVLADTVSDIKKSLNRAFSLGFVSEGPIIEEFSATQMVKDPWLCYIWWQEGDRVVITIKVKSEKPIAKVILIKRRKPIKVFYPRSCKFAKKIIKHYKLKPLLTN